MLSPDEAEFIDRLVEGEQRMKRATVEQRDVALKDLAQLREDYAALAHRYNALVVDSQGVMITTLRRERDEARAERDHLIGKQVTAVTARCRECGSYCEDIEFEYLGDVK